MDTEKITSLFNDYKNAVSRLEEVMGVETTDIVRDAAIQRFEFSFELAWKMLQAIAVFEGIEVNSPREAIRTAAQLELVDDPENWLSFLEARNLTTHTYNQEIAKNVYEKAKDFVLPAKKLQKNIKKYLSTE